MNNVKKIITPINDSIVKTLRVGDIVNISGYIYTARDAAHKLIVEMIGNNQKMPFDFTNQIVYYAGPCPNKPSEVIGSIGPTTSGRMDAYSKICIENGLRFMIGKGFRSEEVKKAIVLYSGIYFAAIGGAAALISKSVKSVEIVAFDDLGTEAIRKLEVVDFPAIVAIDSFGKDIYERD